MAELEHAMQGGKILVPVVREDVRPNLVPEVLMRLNWIFLRATDSFEENYPQLLTALQTADQDYVHTHTRLLVRAREWDTKKRDTSFVLRGKDLYEAEQWRDNSAGKNPAPTLLHIDYIIASRKASLARRRLVVLSSSLAVITVIVLGIFGFNQLQTAQIESQNRATAQSVANQQQKMAQENAARTESVRLAGEAVKLLDSDPELAALLGVGALNIAYSPEADAILATALPNLYEGGA